MRTCLRIVGLGLLVAAAVGCDGFVGKASPAAAQTEQNKAAASETEIVIPVQAELPKRGNIASHFETTTRVEAENRVQVTAEGIGECEKVCVEEGDLVKTGDVLAELDRKTMLATIGQTEVQVRQTKTALDIAERSLGEGIGSKAERDNAQFAHEQALATLNMQQVQLAKLTIRAPITGVITKRNIQVGQVVAMGVPVFHIVEPGSFMLAINPPEKELARLKEGQVAKATIDALGDEEFEARVRRINPGVESSTGTVKVILDVDPAIRKRLREAAFARVRLVMETHENALLVPKDALVEENARKYLFVVQKGEAKQPDQARTKPEGEASAPETKVSETEQPNQDTGSSPESPVKEPEQAEMRLVAERVEVQAGLEDSASVEILSGVDDNSLVVTVGQHTLKSGSAVKVTNATDEILAKSGLSAEDALKAAKEKRAGEDQTRKRPPLHREHRH